MQDPLKFGACTYNPNYGLSFVLVPTEQALPEAETDRTCNYVMTQFTKKPPIIHWANIQVAPFIDTSPKPPFPRKE